MTVIETVAALINRLHAGYQSHQGEWRGDRGSLMAWMDEHAEGRIIISGRQPLGGPHTLEEWASHPALHILTEEEQRHYGVTPYIGLSAWALEDGALDAVLAAGVDADYARAAFHAGVTDAWALIEAWEAGIAPEYLGALS